MFGVIGSLCVNNTNDNISCNINVSQPVQIDNITGDYNIKEI